MVPMKNHRSQDSAITSYQDKIFVFGGYTCQSDGNLHLHLDHEVYDPILLVWMIEEKSEIYFSTNSFDYLVRL